MEAFRQDKKNGDLYSESTQTLAFGFKMFWQEILLFCEFNQIEGKIFKHYKQYSPGMRCSIKL